jgi:hypothetical protein
MSRARPQLENRIAKKSRDPESGVIGRLIISQKELAEAEAWGISGRLIYEREFV